MNSLKTIELEISNNCQAKCPMCSRNTRSGLPNNNIYLNNWTLKDFKQIITSDIINNIDFISFCGNFGDPCMNNALPKMLEHLGNCRFDVHTNGAMRSKKWWVELAKYFLGDNRIVFGIDGLEDTHHLYRIGTTYKKVMDNAKSFIDSGGNAEWVFIRFKHNQHQVQEAMFRAKEIGFKKFTLKDSTRFYHGGRFEVWDKNKNVTHTLEPAKGSQLKSFDMELIYKQSDIHKTIKCQAELDHSIYIDAHYNLYPCSFLAHPIYHNNDPILLEARHTLKQQIDDAIKQFDTINTKQKSIMDIIHTETYQTIWSKLWSQNKLWRCSQICGQMNEISNWKDQFIKVKNL